MHRKHSSDSDDVPLDCYKSCDISTSIMHRKHSSDSDDVPLDSYKTHSTLHKPDTLPCEFCEHVSSSIYASFKHNATHIIIPLVNLTLHQCEDCLHHFTSPEELTTHAELKNHRTSQEPRPKVRRKGEYDDILQSIIQKQLVVKCHDLFNDIKQNSGISQNSTEVSKETNSHNDSTVSKETNSHNEIKSHSTVSKRTNSQNDSAVSKGTNSQNDSAVSKGTNSQNDSAVSKGTNSENDSTVSKTKNVSDVIVKSELPTYVISDSDSNGRNSSLSDTEEQRWTKREVVRTKAECVNYTLKETVENLNAKGEQSSHTESSPETHRKWQYSSDSDSLDANIIEDSKMKCYPSDEEIEEVDQSVFKYKTPDANSSPKRRSSADYEPIRSRLVFEDDLDDDFAEEILPDLPCRAIPNRCLLGKTPNTNSKPNSIILGSQTNSITVKKVLGNGDAENLNSLKILDIGVEEKVLEEYPESVPYETLMKIQICDCRYCGRCFSNRMQLISHETTHLRIRKPRPTLCPHCERFYAGNYRALRKHVEAKHPQVDPDQKRPQSQVCKFCRLSYYNLSRHSQYYHKKQKEEEEQQPVFKKYRYKTMKVCDMCLNWCKNEYIYKLLGSHSEIGRTQICCKCQNRHFSINLVSRRRFRYHNKEAKSISNVERLRRIKKKLKMIKQLNKCFWACFI